MKISYPPKRQNNAHLFLTPQMLPESLPDQFLHNIWDSDSYARI